MNNFIIDKIAEQSFSLDDINMLQHDERYTGLEVVDLFGNAAKIAKKLLGNRQDPISKQRAGQQFREAKNKRTKELTVRRFSIPIGLGIVGVEGSELYSRVKVGENNVRNDPKKMFHPSTISSIAINLFVKDAQELEKKQHLVVCQNINEHVTAKIDEATHDPRQSLFHLTYLLEQTQAASLR
jgi:hypothetical protein